MVEEAKQPSLVAHDDSKKYQWAPLGIVLTKHNYLAVLPNQGIVVSATSGTK